MKERSRCVDVTLILDPSDVNTRDLVETQANVYGWVLPKLTIIVEPAVLVSTTVLILI